MYSPLARSRSSASTTFCGRRLLSLRRAAIRGCTGSAVTFGLICAGISADFCIGLPAKNMAAEGYYVRLVIDASGNDSQIVLQFAIANLTQHGVKVAGWIGIACELQRDWAIQETAEGLRRIYFLHLDILVEMQRRLASSAPLIM
jgi:hypothetical protein